MENFILYDVGAMISSSKRTSHRLHVVTMFDSYIRFLQSNGLTNGPLLKDNISPGAETKIWKSDLTDEGFEFIKVAEQKWFKAVDNGTSPKDCTILENELNKLRSKES